jgi:hypothetical protein
MPPRLSVTVDGAPLPDDEARAFWARFSAHMEDKRGDLEGFARAEGFTSVHPEVHGGVPALVVSRTAPQKKYETARSAPAARDAAAGSRDVHSGARASSGSGSDHAKSRKKKR